ncbi:MAG: hypothetical protein Q9187_006850 [Circinaria calcarea]
MLLHRGRNKDGNHETGLPAPSSTVSNQAVQQASATKTPFHSAPSKFFSSSSVPTLETQQDSQKAWTAQYLSELRSNRPARPSGSRPLPNRHATTTPTTNLESFARTPSALSRPVNAVQQSSTLSPSGPERSVSEMSHQRACSLLSPHITPGGRPLANLPLANSTTGAPTASKAGSKAPPSATYVEREDRWMEKQEARSLRMALEDMELLEEQRLHAAAQDEASDLVWKHQNPGVPFKNPDAPYEYNSRLRKSTHARSQGSGRYAGLGTAVQVQEKTQRSASDGSKSSNSDSDRSKGSRVSSDSSNSGKANNGKSQVRNAKGDEDKIQSEANTYKNLNFPVPPTKLLGSQRSSGPRSMDVSGEVSKGLFNNPEDHIYEEPEEMVKLELKVQDDRKPWPLKLKDRNQSSKVQGAREMLSRASTAPMEAIKKFSRSEIHNNPPSQSRNPSYLRNALPPTPPDSASASEGDAQVDSAFSRKGVEVRSDEIRAATSMRLKDRSPKLPTPTVVSDRPGRPIVSFDHDYKARETMLKHEQSPCSRPSSPGGTEKGLRLPSTKPSMPPSTASAPSIPTINVLESPTIQINHNSPIPSINVPDVPTISISTSEIPTISDSDSNIKFRSLPSPATKPRASNGQRPLPHHSSTAPITAAISHWSPASYRATAQCAACALPIAGRIVSAASQRFHPACFSCFQCGELLECVAFYPEPDTFRSARLGRINARINGDFIPEDEAKQHTEVDDGDDGLRFFCHLDFHEKFSPRCRSCKTPIEGEVVVACGGEWHVGHFFCAECGDPFDANTPFVEKDGYAWCVNCHCKRFSGKCAGCKRPIVDMVVKALEREWHEGCFCCKDFFWRDEEEDY